MDAQLESFRILLSDCIRRLLRYTDGLEKFKKTKVWEFGGPNGGKFIYPDDFPRYVKTIENSIYLAQRDVWEMEDKINKIIELGREITPRDMDPYAE
jgi:hypothetical protein